MMMSEFIERTGYEPSFDEYHYIEESYYEFPGNKDEFCKQWKKDFKDGHWSKELRLRKALTDREIEYSKKADEMEETITFYRPYYVRAIQAEQELAEAQNKLARIQRILNSVGVKEIGNYEA